MIAAIENEIYKIPEFVKKTPAHERANLMFELLDRLEGELSTTDYSNFEATHNPAVLYSIVYGVYMYMTQHNSRARAKILEHLRIRAGTQRLTRHQYTIHLLIAILLSGELDTSLNNGLYNLINCYYHAWKRSGCTLDLTKQYGFVEGDDGIFKFSGCTPTEADYRMTGGNCKIEHPPSIHTASFCGNVIDPDSRTLITDPRKFLHNFPYIERSELNSGPRRVSMILLSKAMSAAHAYNGAPVISPIAWSVIRQYASVLPHMDEFLAQTRHIGTFHREECLVALNYVRNHSEKLPTHSARVFMENVFKMSAFEQLRLEQLVPTLQPNQMYSIATRHQDVDHFNSLHLSSSRVVCATYIDRRGLRLHNFFRPSGPAAALSMSAMSGALLIVHLLYNLFSYMNVKRQQASPTPAATSSSELVAPPRSKSSKLSALGRILNGGAPNHQEGAQRPPQGSARHEVEQAQDRKTAQRRRRVARLGNPEGQAVRTRTDGTDRNSDLKAKSNRLAFVRLAVHVQPPATHPHFHCLSPDELAAASERAGIPPPKTFTNKTNTRAIYCQPAAKNAVETSPDLLTLETSVGDAAIAHSHDITMNGDGTMTYSGSELLSDVRLPGAVDLDSPNPAGMTLVYLPVNPRFIDGSRLGQFLEQYDQFALEEVTFEYISGSNVLTTAGDLVMTFINDTSDTTTLETGFAAIRDLFSRTGSTTFSPRKNARAKLGRPLLKWYYTASQSDASLEMPGAITIQNAIAQPTLLSATDPSAKPFGLLAMHYKVRVRAPVVDTNISPQFYTERTYLDMISATITQGAPVIVNITGFGPQPSLLPGTIVWGIISGVDDTVGSPAWRVWQNSRTGALYMIQPGNVLFMRISHNNIVYFFPTFTDAINSQMEGVQGGNFFAASATVAAATVKGFEMYNLMGCDVSGDDGA